MRTYKPPYPRTLPHIEVLFQNLEKRHMKSALVASRHCARILQIYWEYGWQRQGKDHTIMGLFNIHMAMCDNTCNNKMCVNNKNLTPKPCGWMALDIWHTHPTHISYPINNHVGFSTNLWQLHVAWIDQPWPLFCMYNKGMFFWHGPSYHRWLWELPWESLWIIHSSFSNLDSVPHGCSHAQCSCCFLLFLLFLFIKCFKCFNFFTCI